MQYINNTKCPLFCGTSTPLTYHSDILVGGQVQPHFPLQLNPGEAAADLIGFRTVLFLETWLEIATTTFTPQA
jgi:hypothetical protein